MKQKNAKENTVVPGHNKSLVNNNLLNSKAIVDFDHIIYESLINENKHIEVLNTISPPFVYNEKELREAAHAEVAMAAGLAAEAETEKNSKKKKSLDLDEKNKLSRDRNREHAKFTRLRKKAFVGKLKDLLDDMKLKTEKEEAERLALGQAIYKKNQAQITTVQNFLQLRARNCRDRPMWTTLLEDEVVLTQPITPYRSFPRSEIQGGCRVARGVDAVLVDTASLGLMVESIGLGSALWRQAMKRNLGCKIEYIVEPDDIFSTGSLVMCRYAMHIRACEGVGAAGDCVQYGMLQCLFGEVSGRIAAVEFVFDVMAFMQQLQMCWGISPESSIVANTLDSAAVQTTKEPQAIISAVSPYPLLQANEAWRQQFLGSVAAEQGEGMSLLQAVTAYAFQRDMLNKLASNCARGVPGSAMFLSHGNTAQLEDSDSGYYTRNKNKLQSMIVGPTVLYIKLLPLTADTDSVSHFLASLVELPLSPEESQAAAERAALLSSTARSVKTTTPAAVVVAPNSRKRTTTSAATTATAAATIATGSNKISYSTLAVSGNPSSTTTNTTATTLAAQTARTAVAVTRSNADHLGAQRRQSFSSSQPGLPPPVPWSATPLVQPVSLSHPGGNLPYTYHQQQPQPTHLYVSSGCASSTPLSQYPAVPGFVMGLSADSSSLTSSAFTSMHPLYVSHMQPPALGTAGVGEVYLSQEALRCNPNGGPRPVTTAAGTKRPSSPSAPTSITKK